MSLDTRDRGVYALLAVALGLICANSAHAQWAGYAGNAQHTADSAVASQPLDKIRWQAAVDLNPQYSGDELLIHYGSPAISPANTVIVPVKTGAGSGFKIDARDGSNGNLKWSLTTDYQLPPHSWIPSYSPTLTVGGRVYFPGAGGTVLYRDSVDSAAGASGRVAFFGDSTYSANTSAFNSSVFINTPLTSDAAGNVYFGFRVTTSTPLGASFTSGIARIAPDGSGTWNTALGATTNETVDRVALNCAPAISADGTKLYVATRMNSTSRGDLVELNAATLAPIASRALVDPVSSARASVNENGTASPLIGPDGDVYYGVLEGGSNNHSRGYMLHFSGDLSQVKTSGGFGWDDTASVVPASMISSYHGPSSYLLMTKYNNYAGSGGDGVNKIAILDPNATQTDAITGLADMKEIETIAGPTPDPDFDVAHPGAVREWCINTAVVDPATDSILANNEDGKLYRWNLGSNTFTQQMTLTTGVGEAYTPTLIGPDGSVYAINNGILFNVGAVPEPATGAAMIPLLALLRRRR